MKFSTLSTALILSLSAAGAFAQAKAPEPDYTLSFNVGATTDYRFRGIAQTSRKPALQGGADFSHKSGFYAGVWGSSVTWVKNFNGATKGSSEIDVYGGFKSAIGKDLSLDVGLITYQYPGNNSGAAGTPGAGAASNANTNEWYVGATYGMVTAKYSRSSGNFLGILNSRGSNYLDLSANIDMGNGFTLTPHIGRQTVVKNGLLSYTDYALTLGKDMGNGLSLSAALVGSNGKKVPYTDLKGKFLANDALVLGAKFSF